VRGACLLASCLTMGCARSSPAPATAVHAATPLHVSPLADLVPSAGLRWIVEARPRALLAEPSVLDALSTTLAGTDLDAVTRACGGLDVRSSDDFVVAGYEASTVLLAHEVIDPPRIEAAFTARVADVEGRAIDSASHDSRESVTRLWGASGKDHESVVVFGREAVGYCAGADAPLRAAELFAVRKLKRARPAWQTPPLDQLGVLLGEAPFRAAAPGPFVGDWSLGLGGLLASASAVGLAALVDGETLRVHAVLAGDWGQRAHDAEERLERAYTTLTVSAVGRLLGLDKPAAPPRFTSRPDSIDLDVRLALRPLAIGIRDATSSGVADMMRGARPALP